MDDATFTSVLLTGHKEDAFEVPFDPSERWGVAAVPLRPGRRGYPVHGSVNGVKFESAIVGRSRKFYLLVDEVLRGRASLSAGASAKVTIRVA
jgi:hypothetical protein